MSILHTKTGVKQKCCFGGRKKFNVPDFVKHLVCLSNSTWLLSQSIAYNSRCTWKIKNSLSSTRKVMQPWICKAPVRSPKKYKASFSYSEKKRSIKAKCQWSV